MTRLFPDPEELVNAVLAHRQERETANEVTPYDAVFMETCGVNIFAHVPAANGYVGRMR